MTGLAFTVARDYCAPVCLFASESGFRLKREETPQGPRFLIRFPSGQVIAGEPRPTAQHALVAACKLLPL